MATHTISTSGQVEREAGRKGRNSRIVSRRARGLLVIHLPDTVPVRGRRAGLEVLDALEEGQRWSVVRGDLQNGPERIACVLPALCPVSGQSFRISVPQGRLSCR